MARAVWRDRVIAEGPEVQEVDGYTYFPSDAVKWEHLRESSHTSRCGWKGSASYWDVVAGDDVNRNAAWSYRTPLPAAAHLAGWVGFWRGVRIES